VIAQALAPEILFRKLIGLDHRPHGAIEDENPLRQGGAELGDTVLPVVHWSLK
jgi:hypothetical protein